MKILVTGATGYIGAHVVKALAEHGYLITATDFNWHQNDIYDYLWIRMNWDIRRTLGPLNNHYDAVVHLAAVGMVGPSISNPWLYYNTNLFGTQNVIQAFSTDHFIYCSTGSAFNPSTSPYAMSKRAAEDLVERLDNYTICRFYNVGGNNGFKKYEDGYNHLIRKAAAVVNGRFPSLTVYGTDYETRDGTTIRNYSHINDIVKAVIEIIKNGPTKKIECLGNTTGYSVLEVIESMKQVSKTDINVVHSERRIGDPAVSILPNQSVFFKEEHTLEDQCLSALVWEK